MKPAEIEFEAQVYEAVMVGFEKYPAAHLPEGGAIISFDMPSRLLPRLKRMAARQGITPAHLAVEITQRHIRRTSKVC